jgi:ferrochelatase
MNKKGVLLINLGTPDNCDPKSVRRYLKQFLNDPMVIDLPSIVRWFLVNCLIIPRRYKNSAEAYQKIWLKEAGSPLLVYSEAMKEALSIELGTGYHVELGMRYGNPSIQTALEKLQGCDTLRVLPLFPQYATASTGSAIAHFLNIAAQSSSKTFKSSKQWGTSEIRLQEDFHQHPGFIAAYADIIQKYTQAHIKNKKLDMILFSYHGIPIRQLQKSPRCYRTQCLATSDALANRLGLSSIQYRVSFQSRLGRTPWIKPYTDLVLPELIQQGIRNIAIVCPSFVADCLETLEEINIRAREQWQALGGNNFIFIPCLNTEPLWIKAMAEIVGE